CTARDPAVNETAPNSVPVVPPLVLFVVTKPPRIVAVALMLKTALAAELSIAPADAVPSVSVGRLAFEYAVLSNHPACDAIVSAAEYALKLALSTKPTKNA